MYVHTIREEILFFDNGTVLRSNVDIQMINRQNVEKMTENVDNMTENVEEMTENVDEMTENVDKMTENVNKMTDNVDFICPRPQGIGATHRGR
jgi:predicted translin family RNA/ssDNA-binding protein